MLNHHMAHEQPPQEWSSFHGKLSVLKEKEGDDDSGNKQHEWQLYGENRESHRVLCSVFHRLQSIPLRVLVL